MIQREYRTIPEITEKKLPFSNHVIELIDDLRYDLEGKNYSPKTVDSYVNYTIDFYKWLENGKLDGKNLKKYCLSLKRKYSCATTRIKICALRYFLTNILERNDLIQFIPVIKQESRLPVILSKKEVKDIIFSALNDTHRMYLKVIYYCGLRLNEFMGIKIKDIDFDRKNILIHGKGKKDRFVPISDELISNIKDSICNLNKNDYLCSSLSRGPLNKVRRLSNKAIQSLVKDCAERAGITKRVYPHLFRHSIATHLIESGVDIRYIQVFLGHTSIFSTSTYTHIANMDESLLIKNIHDVISLN